jgi:hypothetical protein
MNSYNLSIQLAYGISVFTGTNKNKNWNNLNVLKFFMSDKPPQSRRQKK